MVKRIVLNVNTPELEKAASFYKDILGLDVLMDLGWITTYGLVGEAMDVQISFAKEGGSGTPTPNISIEVDNLEEVLQRVKAAGFPVQYGPVDEPWGVRRFYTRDPFGKMVNILSHI